MRLASGGLPVMRSQALTNILLSGATSTAAGNGVTTGKTGNLAFSRPLAQSLNFFINYSAAQQSSSAALGSNAILGISQTMAFGLSYSPRAVRLTK